MATLSMLYDKFGIPIERGDVVKVYHFTAALRRKRHYMYKQCLGLKGIGPNGDTPYLAFSHLNFVEDSTARDGPYLEKPDGRVMSDYEIVQSVDANFENRPRRLSPKEDADHG